MNTDSYCLLRSAKLFRFLFLLINNLAPTMFIYRSYTLIMVICWNVQNMFVIFVPHVSHTIYKRKSSVCIFMIVCEIYTVRTYYMCNAYINM